MSTSQEKDATTNPDDIDENVNIEWKKRRKWTPQELLEKAPSIIEDLKVDSTFFSENKCRNLASFTNDGKSKINC